VFITPLLTGCTTSESLEIQHPINYALFLSFDFNPDQYDALKLLNISVTLDIPDITTSVKNFTDLNTKMISDGLKLETVSEAILEARQTYEKTKVYLDGSLTFLPFIESPWTAAIFGLIVIIVLALLILAISALVAKIF